MTSILLWYAEHPGPRSVNELLRTLRCPAFDAVIYSLKKTTRPEIKEDITACVFRHSGELEHEILKDKKSKLYIILVEICFEYMAIHI